MDPGIVAALITASISLVLAIFSSWASYRTQSRLAKQNAKLDYEYEARKNLYRECEPYIFQLIEASETALNHIKYLAKKAKGPKGVVFSDQYDLKTTVYYLLLPSAVFKVISKRLTFVDLQVDDMVYAQYILAKSIYSTFTSDFELSQLFRIRDYQPYVENWREKRKVNPQVYRRQGFALGRLDNALEVLIEGNETKGYNFMSFGDFEQKFDIIKDDDVNSDLGTPKDLFSMFHPHTRPILWRILIVQALLYKCIQEVSLKRNMSSDEIMNFLKSVTKEEMLEFDWRSEETKQEESSVFEPFEVAQVYLNQSLTRQLVFLKSISQRKANSEKQPFRFI